MEIPVWRCPNRARHDFFRSFHRRKVALLAEHGRLATHAQEHVVLGLGPQQERLGSLQEQCRVAFLHCDMVNTYIQCSWRLRNMATSIRLDPETEHRLDVLATQTGRTKAFYLREIIERGLEDLEDYYLAADVLERFRHGTENVYSSSDVRHALHLDD